VPYYYHGTAKENAESILKEGFHDWTYFSDHLEDAIGYGGPYVFEVFFEQDMFEEDLEECREWQFRWPEPIPPSEIHTLINYNPDGIHWNPDVEKRQYALLFEEEDPTFTVCERCGGRGQLESYPPWFTRKDKVTLCPDCGGYGSPEKYKMMNADWKHNGRT